MFKFVARLAIACLLVAGLAGPARPRRLTSSILRR